MLSVMLETVLLECADFCCFTPIHFLFIKQAWAPDSPVAYRIPDAKAGLCGGAGKGVFSAVPYQNRVIMLDVSVLEKLLGSLSASAQIPDQSTMLIFTDILRSTQVSSLSLLLSKYR